MPHTRGPFTVEELSDSAETERDLGVTRIVCAPAQYEDGETIAIAFVMFPDDAPLFAAAGKLLKACELADRHIDPDPESSEPWPDWEEAVTALREAMAAARGEA
jgi:hypothetical protein